MDLNLSTPPNNSLLDCALILAAGFGTRLQPLTLTTPKCLININGKALLAHAIARVAPFVEKIYINTHYLAAQVHDFIAKKNYPNVTLLEEDPILETGGTIRALCRRLGRESLNILVHNADAHFYGEEFMRDFVSHYCGQEFYLDLIEKARLPICEEGDFIVDDHQHLRFYKGGEFVYTGLSIINSQRFARAKEEIFSLTEFLKDSNSLGYFVMPHRAYWMDIGTPQKLDYIKNVVQRTS